VDAETLQQPISALQIREPVCVPPTVTTAEAIRAMQRTRTGCVLVVEEGRLIGIFTERDVLRRVALTGEQGANRPVSELMTGRPAALETDDSIVYALNRMHVGGYRHLPILSGGKRLGVSSIRDILNYLAQRLVPTG
jgi:CBS domain-containing protein